MIQLIIGAAISVVSIILGFVLNVVYENHRENRKTRNESLKNHFKQLQASVIKPMSDIMQGITNDGGSLSIKGASYGSLYYASLIKNLEQGKFHIFKLHFPDQAEKVTGLMREVDKHNEPYESFTNKLKGLIEEKTGLPVTEGGKRPFIYSDVRYHLRKTLIEFAKGESLTYDFREVTIEKKNDFWEIYKGGNIYAQVTTEEEGNSCKRGLIELMESTSLLEEILNILKKATELENEAKSIANLLDFICWQYRESGQLLNEEKDCPYCQIIFHPKKKRSKHVQTI